jgi:hypothetical protein
MTDEPKSSEQTWREVGDQFRALGESMAAAFRATWENEENRQHLQELRDSLQSMATSLGDAVQDAARSPQAQRAEEELRKAAKSAEAAGQQAWQDAEPHLLSALQKANAELDKIIRRVEQRRQPGASPDGGQDAAP